MNDTLFVWKEMSEYKLNENCGENLWGLSVILLGLGNHTLFKLQASITTGKQGRTQANLKENYISVMSTV